MAVITWPIFQLSALRRAARGNVHTYNAGRMRVSVDLAPSKKQLLASYLVEPAQVPKQAPMTKTPTKPLCLECLPPASPVCRFFSFLQGRFSVCRWRVALILTPLNPRPLQFSTGHVVQYTLHTSLHAGRQELTCLPGAPPGVFLHVPVPGGVCMGVSRVCPVFVPAPPREAPVSFYREHAVQRRCVCGRCRGWHSFRRVKVELRRRLSRRTKSQRQVYRSLHAKTPQLLWRR